MYASFTNWPGAAYLLTGGAALLLLIMIGSLFIERFFCRYACPLGAFLSIVSLVRPFKIKKPRDACGTCKLCTSCCPMGIALNKTDVIRSGECINCFACVESCCRHNVTVKLAPPVAAACAAASIAGLYYVGNLLPAAATTTQTETTLSKLAAVSEAAEDTGPYEDGTFEGSASGFRGTTDVEVTVENGYIEDITVTSTDDDTMYISRAERSVIPAILLTQSTDVSAVSGATFSSLAIMNAVSDALELRDSSAEDTGAASAVTTPAESGTTTDEAASSSGDSQSSGSYTDGTYTGTGYGFGETTVTVTVTAGIIADITIVSYADDTPYMSRAESVITSILSSQDVNVNTVSGATFSSNGIIDAVADALGVTVDNASGSGSYQIRVKAKRVIITAKDIDRISQGRPKGRPLNLLSVFVATAETDRRICLKEHLERVLRRAFEQLPVDRKPPAVRRAIPRFLGVVEIELRAHVRARNVEERHVVVLSPVNACFPAPKRITRPSPASSVSRVPAPSSFERISSAIDVTFPLSAAAGADRKSERVLEYSPSYRQLPVSISSASMFRRACRS
jgi:uncharacterized protein with FMN-binding domain